MNFRGFQEEPLMHLRKAVLCLALLALPLYPTVAAAVADALAPDTVLHNGKIVTVDKNFATVQAVAIKNGRFVAVGSDSDILALAGAKTEKVDLGGKTVLPGFYDSHLHLAWPVGQAPDPLIARFGRARSIAEILDVVREKLSATPPGKLVVIFEIGRAHV